MSLTYWGSGNRFSVDLNQNLPGNVDITEIHKAVIGSVSAWKTMKNREHDVLLIFCISNETFFKTSYYNEISNIFNHFVNPIIQMTTLIHKTIKQ